MRTSIVRAFAAAYVVVAAGETMTAAAPPSRTLGVDAVEARAGRQTAGKPEWSLVYEGIEYRFTSAENRAAFEKEPERFEVADGGACGRMGPLSGLGDARRHAVHDGRVYFFASDGCREGFLKDPAAYLERADEMPFGSHEDVVRGRATLDKVVTWAGGPEHVRGVTGFRAWSTRTERQGETDWTVRHETVIAFPKSYFQRESWNESWFSTLAGPGGGAMGTAKGVERIASSRARAFVRVMSRWPIVILRARVDGAPAADCPGLVVMGDGEGRLGETPVEYVRVWLNGAQSRLTVESATGRLLELEYHGRDGSMRVGKVRRTFTAWATQDGLTLPTAYRVTLDGKELPRAGATLDGFEVNAKAAPGLFDAPEWPAGE